MISVTLDERWVCGLETWKEALDERKVLREIEVQLCGGNLSLI
jgi:hypothetical protein